MIGPKARNAMVAFFTILVLALILSSCSMEEISDTIGSCCGASALPIGAVGLFALSFMRRER